MVKVVHIMADGSVLDDIKGITVPVVPETEGAYRIMATLYQAKNTAQERRDSVIK